MAALVPGVLLKLLQHMNTDIKIAGEHRSSLLQVVGIVPALAGSDLFASKGFYLKVSDSSHATYVSLPDEHDDLIRSDRLQLGQFIFVDRLEAASPVPILRGVKPVPGRHTCMGSPEDIVATNSLSFLSAEKSSPSGSSRASSVSEKERSKGGRPKEEPARAKVLLSRSSSSVSKQALSVSVRKDAGGKTKAGNSRSVPSSPTSCYSLPATFEKFSAGVKQQVKIKQDRSAFANSSGSKMGLLEKAASVFKGTASGRRSVSGNSAGSNLPLGVDSGSKALRKSWEGNLETKGKDGLKTRAAKTETKPETRSTSAPKRNPTGGKPSVMEDNKAHSSPKKCNTPGNVDDMEKTNKQRSPMGKKTSEASVCGIFNNLVKIVPNNRRWTDGSVSWASLPPNLVKLGKEVLQYRDSAQLAAIEAMQEASAAESLLRCLSMYAELCSSAKEENPQPSVEQFLSLYANLKRASLVAESLQKTATSTSPVDQLSEDVSNIALQEERGRIFSEKRKYATSWVQAALATDLSPITIFCKPSSPIATSASPAVLVVESPSKTTPSKANQVKPRASTNSSKSSVSVSSATRGKQRATPPPPPPEWVRGNGLDESADLAKGLREISRDWFLEFVNRFLGADVDASTLSDRGQVAGMLSQLKKVNDWLDEVRGPKEEDAEEDCRECTHVPNETIENLRKKIYEYLLTHVESAAVALGGSSTSPVPAQVSSDRKNQKG